MLQEIKLTKGKETAINGVKTWGKEYEQVFVERNEDGYFIKLDNQEYGPYTNIFASPYQDRYCAVVAFKEDGDCDLYKSMQYSWERTVGYTSVYAFSPSLSDEVERKLNQHKQKVVTKAMKGATFLDSSSVYNMLGKDHKNDRGIAVVNFGDDVFMTINHNEVRDVYKRDSDGAIVIADPNRRKICGVYDRYDEALLRLSVDEGYTLQNKIKNIPEDGLLKWFNSNRGCYGITDRKMLTLYNGIKHKLGEDYKHLAGPIEIKVTRKQYFTIEDLCEEMKNCKCKNLRSYVKSELSNPATANNRDFPIYLSVEFKNDIGSVLKSDSFKSRLSAYNIYDVKYNGKTFRLYDSKEAMDLKKEIEWNPDRYIPLDYLSKMTSKIKENNKLLEIQNQKIHDIRRFAEKYGIRRLYLLDEESWSDKINRGGYGD